MARLVMHGLKSMMDPAPNRVPYEGFTITEVYLSKEDFKRLQEIVGRIDTETSMTIGQAISYLIQRS